MTLGLLVLVQLVMAAMTTSPCFNGNSLSFHLMGIPLKPGSSGLAAGVGWAAALLSILWPPSPSQRPSGEPLADGGRLAYTSVSACRQAGFILASGTRSCGRFGPARLGSTVERSRRTILV